MKKFQEEQLFVVSIPFPYEAIVGPAAANIDSGVRLVYGTAALGEYVATLLGDIYSSSKEKMIQILEGINKCPTHETIYSGTCSRYLVISAITYSIKS